MIVAAAALAGLLPRATPTIDLEEFVDLDSIDPRYFDGAYWVAPDDRAAKPYALLVEAMEQANKVAIARFVMRAKQYVAVMRPHDGRLVLSMMVYDDEINPSNEIGEFDQLDDVELSTRELTMAEQLIESLSADFEPTAFHDGYREELLDLIHAKEAGEERVVATVEGPEEDKVIDLMAALEASVAAARESRGRHPSTSAEEEGPDGVDEADGGEVDGGEVDGGVADGGEAPASSSHRSSSDRKPAASKPAKAKASAKRSVAKETAAKSTAKKSAPKATGEKAGQKAAAKKPVRKSA